MASLGKSDTNFKVGELVWARMKGFPPWPGLVTEPTEELKTVPKKGDKNYSVFFFGTRNYGWIEQPHLKPYEEYKEKLVKAGKTSIFQEACKDIEEYIARGQPGIGYLVAKNQEEMFDLLIKQPCTSKVTKKAPRKESPKVPRESSPVPSIEASSDDDDSFLLTNKSNHVRSPKKRVTITRRRRGGSSPSLSQEEKRPRLFGPDSEDEASALSTPSSSTNAKKRSVTATNNGKNPYVALKQLSNVQLMKYPACRSGSESPEPFSGPSPQDSDTDTPNPPNPLALSSVSRTLIEKCITPSNRKFGFLGLGIMGAGIVKNLLDSGHEVVIWNRTPRKYKELKAAGATTAASPRHVVRIADITFCCVSNPKAAKDLMFGRNGALTEIDGSKGYVEMTGIDSETSLDIEEAITNKGGRYLEAQLQGSKLQAEEGTTIILTAGDRTLYNECHSCFEAFGRSSFYLGDVGAATKMNLVIQLMTGVYLAGLAEGMALADRAGLQHTDLLEILNLTSLACPLLTEKGKAIIDGGFATHLPLQHLQKDLKLSLDLSDQLEQSLPLTASANEVFKHARRLGYGEHDASAVYIRARF